MKTTAVNAKSLSSALIKVGASAMALSLPFLFFGLSPVQAADESQIKVSPAKFTLTLSSHSPVELDFKLDNQFEKTVEFKLELSSEIRAKTNELGLDLSVVAGGKAAELGAEGIEIKAAAQKETPIRLILTPRADTDFELTLPVKLTQTGGETRLNNENYELTLNISSKLGSTNGGISADLLLAGGVAGIAILAIVGYFVYERRQN